MWAAVCILAILIGGNYVAMINITSPEPYSHMRESSFCLRMIYDRALYYLDTAEFRRS